MYVYIYINIYITMVNDLSDNQSSCQSVSGLILRLIFKHKSDFVAGHSSCYNEYEHIKSFVYSCTICLLLSPGHAKSQW